MNVLYRLIAILLLLAGTAASVVGQASVSTHNSSGPEFVSCSPAPCVLAPVQVSPGPNSADTAPIAADPSNPRNIIVGSDDYNCGPEGAESLGFFITLDGGSAWSQYCMPARSNNGQLYLPGLGPILGYDLNGVAYIAGWYADNSSGSNVVFEGFEKSSDGVHWSLPAPAVYRKDYGPNCDWLAVDTSPSSPYANSVYISCVMSGRKDSQLVVSHSNDGGATWHQVNVAPPQVYPAEPLYQSMTVGKDGTIYLAWLYCQEDNGCGNGPASVMFSRSSDGGDTWSRPSPLARVTLVYPLPNVPDGFVPDTPAIGVDTGDGPYAGNLYVSMYNWTGTFMQVVVARSTDGGNTWSKLVPVAPPSDTHDQFFPWLSVSPTGQVGVAWLDRRNDPANINYQAFAGISSDGGLSFEPNVPLTDVFSDLQKDNGPFGYYDGATWDGPNYFLAAWMDESNGINTQDFVGGIRLK